MLPHNEYRRLLEEFDGYGWVIPREWRHALHDFWCQVAIAALLQFGYDAAVCGGLTGTHMFATIFDA
jgi:hypothetical protein